MTESLPEIPRFSADAKVDDVSASVLSFGAAIIESQAAPELLETIKSELRPHFDEQGALFQNDFNGYSTLRLGQIPALSRSAVDLIAHPRILELTDAILLPHCDNYQLGSATAIEIHPGEQAQKLHRDDSIYPIPIPGVEFQISVMWALNDFTESNGATRVAPNNHNREPKAPYTQEDTVAAEMPAGSALIYLGSSTHGGGANRSGEPRTGLINTYCLGWLRQEENYYLSVPRDVADSYPEHVRRLMGYQAHGESLGVYPGDPDDYWYDA